MNFIKTIIFALFLVFQITYLQAFEDKVSKNFMGLYEVKQGILAHDRGWFGENREGFGPDYNFELMFNSPTILKKIWSPKPVIGLTQTSTGGSSLYYGGITWDVNITKNWFVTGTTGIAYTNGLSKLPKGQVPTGDKKSTRIEHRVSGAEANSYLVLSSVLSGIHYGIVNKLLPDDPRTDNACVNPDEKMPKNLKEALKLLNNSKILPKYFSKEYIELYVDLKSKELATINNEISDVEYKWYLNL